MVENNPEKIKGTGENCLGRQQHFVWLINLSRDEPPLHRERCLATFFLAIKFFDDIVFRKVPLIIGRIHSTDCCRTNIKLEGLLRINCRYSS